MSSLDFFLKNVDYTNKPDVYRAQLLKAAEMAEWKKLWHPRGDTTKGYLKRGMGIGVNFWGGLGHDAKAITKILPDGSVEIEIGSQDLGTGTRTTITQVAAESLGIPMNLIKLKLGDNDYPPAGASGGSTTIGGTSAAARKSAVNALQALFEKVAGSLDTTPENLEAVDGRIQVKGNPKRNLTWKAACAKLGVETISAQGENLSRNAMREGLINQGAAGVQIADVTVDIETGVVKMNRVVAVQDCGLVVNPKLAESQVYGAIIMNICGALLEERVMDEATGRFLNADMEFYKLAGISDIGEILVHMDITEEHDKRGIIGLGEPPTAGTLAAISNAVANAVGVRVPHLPLTPDRVLAALANRRNA
jgi:xanthine dehydrogenase YagR molybdenum-binding subunit